MAYCCKSEPHMAKPRVGHVEPENELSEMTDTPETGLRRVFPAR